MKVKRILKTAVVIEDNLYKSIIYFIPYIIIILLEAINFIWFFIINIYTDSFLKHTFKFTSRVK